MAARTPVRELSPLRDLQPAAAPVDTYVRPAMPERSPLHHVAQSLGELGEGARSLMAERQANADEEARLQGEAAFYRDHQSGLTQGVASGSIPGHHSPAFMEGLRGAQGQVSGIRMRQDFNARFQAWEARHTASPEDFQSWYGEFVNEHLSTDDPDQLRSLLPHVETLTGEAYQTFERIRNERVMANSITTHVGISAVTIDEAFNQAFGTADDVPFEALWDDLLAQREASLATGIPPQRYDQNLFDTIITKAIEHSDESLLGLLDQVLPGQEIPLSQHPEFLEDRIEVEGRVRRAIATQEEEAYRAQVEQDQEREDAIIREVMTFLSESPNGQIDQPVLDEWAALDPMALVKLERIRATFNTARSAEDPGAILRVELAILQGATRAEIMGMTGPDGPIRSAQTLARLMGRVEQRTEANQALLRAPAYDRYRELLKERLWAVEMNEQTGTFQQLPTEQYITAMRDLEIAAIEWLASNPNASLLEQQQAMDEIGRFILRRVETPASLGVDAEYRSQEDYLEAIGDAERQAPSQPDAGAAERADRLPVTPGFGAPGREAPDAEARRLLDRLSTGRD